MATVQKTEKGPQEVGQVASHFLDSGAFTIWTKAAKYATKNKSGSWAYYDTAEFWQYVDDYAEFVKKHQAGIDLYANVDAIPNPELTWRNQKYLEEKHGLSPVPVVHYRTDLKWLRRYMEAGYELIGLGGLVGSMGTDSCRDWLDSAFDVICNQSSRLPKVKIHGFGVTGYEYLLRYPWWSVDSVTWAKIGAYGGILVPHKRKGKFVFTEAPYIVKVSVKSNDRKLEGKHYLTLSLTEQKIVREWLLLINIPLGTEDEQGNVIEYGVLNRHTERRAACLLFFEEMRKSLPEWPWPFCVRKRRGFTS